MELREYVDELRLQLKVVFTNRWQMDARWKCGSNGIKPILKKCRLNHNRI